MRIRVLMASALLVGLLNAVPSPLAAAAVPITGMYTDMRYIRDAGDVLGMEVFVVGAGRGWYAVVQCAGGEPATPVVVPLKANRAQITFTLPEGLPECGQEFVGIITRSGLRGRFRGESTDRWLRRHASYWQQ